METVNGNAGFVHVLLDIAEAMMSCGAEIDRVEGTVSRMGHAFGAERVNVFAITSSIVVTLEMPDGEVLTQTRRVQGVGETDFTRLEALNNLSREYCAGQLTAEELKKRFDAALKPFSRLKYYIGSVVAAGAFAVFFGGTAWDALAAAIFAVLVCCILRSAPKFCPNHIVAKLLCSFVVGVSICAVCRLLPVLNMDKIMIGDIMLLIPGIALTNAIRNILIGDTVSGLIRLTESLVQAAALAGGFMLAIIIFGG